MKQWKSAAYLFGGSRAVIYQYQSTDNISSKSHYGDEVRRHPERHFAHQPAPVSLHEGLQERSSRTAVLMLLQPFQLLPGQTGYRKLHQLGQETGALFHSCWVRVTGRGETDVRIGPSPDRSLVCAHASLSGFGGERWIHNEIMGLDL